MMLSLLPKAATELLLFKVPPLETVLLALDELKFVVLKGFALNEGEVKSFPTEEDLKFCVDWL